MRDPNRILPLALVFFLALPMAGRAASSETAAAPPSTRNGLGAGDRGRLESGLAAAKRKQWKRVRQLASKMSDPVAAKILRWRYYSGGDDAIDFMTLARFIVENPDWPRQKALMRKAEKAMGDDVGDADRVAWFTKYPPVSTEGQQSLAEVLLRRGKEIEAVKWLRYIWIEGDLAHKESRQFYNRYKGHLTKDDHLARLDRLLWAGHRASARRMLPLVPPGWRRLAEARLALMVGSPGVNSAIARVPKELLGDPGLAYQRVRWRRQRDKHDSAQDLLGALPGDPGPKPEKWWVERRIQIRKLLEVGNADGAYALAGGHGQTPGTGAYAEAEWLAGWIALRFLKNYPGAARHFQQLHKAVKYPISRARAAYWRARAAAAMAQGNHATRWYRTAAKYPTTYYGQLATEALDAKAKLHLRPTPPPRPEQWLGFKRRDAVKAAAILGELRDWTLFRSFVFHLAKQVKSPAERMMVAGLAAEFRRFDLGVRVAKIAKRSSERIVEYGYPVFRLPKITVEDALVFAIMRQESEFSATAVSPAGARGLMQLMPATAREVSRALRLRYSSGRLLSDPDYNVRLGAAYIGQMLKDFNGSYPLAIAAYNAGPGRAREWIRKLGDPRDGSVDVIDWIEAIPFNETRNYVQRVLEGLQVYRQRLAPAPVPSRLTMDLKRNGDQP
jgi:soluble lytic murein transglycosylase